MFGAPRSRAVQTDQVLGTAEHRPEPHGPKVFFRVRFGDRLLQFKLAIDCALAVLFARVDAAADFTWHGVALDKALTPAHYNLLPGEEHAVTLHAVRSTTRTTTHAEDLLAADVARSVVYQRQAAEGRAEQAQQELEAAHAELAALQQDLRDVRAAAAARARDDAARAATAAETIRRLEHDLSAAHDELRVAGVEPRRSHTDPDTAAQRVAHLDAGIAAQQRALGVVPQQQRYGQGHNHHHVSPEPVPTPALEVQAVWLDPAAGTERRLGAFRIDPALVRPTVGVAVARACALGGLTPRTVTACLKRRGDTTYVVVDGSSTDLPIRDQDTVYLAPAP